MKKSVSRKELTQDQIIKKLESYCAYRERCEAEIIQKLYQLSIVEKEAEFYVSYLKENNFLNEERFVNAFTNGKFNIKSWGKRKIVQALQAKKIDSKKIQKSVVNIDEGMYYVRLLDLLTKKNRNLKEPDVFKRKQKLINYALQKGYEIELINDVLSQINVA